MAFKVREVDLDIDQSLSEASPYRTLFHKQPRSHRKNEQHGKCKICYKRSSRDVHTSAVAVMSAPVDLSDA